MNKKERAGEWNERQANELGGMGKTETRGKNRT